ncbi:MAG: ATP-binding cassette domain-containing protein [Puniceicoccales bacterium]|jgi:putative ABC transport system ATP-binding protein|nr:ATP-binding cassette domain-containing protein [Puniceicoccales bacterium]
MLTVENLSASYGGGKDVLSAVNLAVAAGELVTVVGPNGGGKSTLLGAISGAVGLGSGHIFMDGKENDFSSVCRVFQDPHVGTVGDFTIFENMALAWCRGGRRLPIPWLTRRRKTIFRQHLSELEMGLETRGDELARSLSGGQRQALSLAMATARNCKVLLLDEITAALDPRAAERLMNLVERIVRQSKCACLAVTHGMHQAISHGDRILVVRDGAIATQFSGDEKSSLSVADLFALFEFPFANGRHDINVLP